MVPALGDLAPLLDAAAPAALLAPHLGEGVLIEDCRPSYIRYRPGRSLVVQYDLTLRTAAGPARRTAHLRLFPDGRAERRAAGERLTGLAALVVGREPRPPWRTVAHLPEHRALLQVYPVDHDLPFLARAQDPATVAALFARAGALPPGVALGDPELVRYKPGRKALLRYPTSDGRRLYVKLHSDDRAGRLAAQTKALVDAGVATPAVLLAEPGHGLISHAEYAGTALLALRGTAGFREAMRPAGAALRALRSVPVPHAPAHTPDDEARRVASNAAWLAHVLPHLAPRAAHLREAITAGLARLAGEPATGHGDFYDDQLVLHPGGGLTLIDLDELRTAHPGHDVANMLAHLRRAGRHDAHREFAHDAVAHGPSTAAELAVLEAAALVTHAPGPLRRVEEDWPAGIERIVALAEDALAEAA